MLLMISLKNVLFAGSSSTSKAIMNRGSDGWLLAGFHWKWNRPKFQSKRDTDAETQGHRRDTPRLDILGANRWPLERWLGVFLVVDFVLEYCGYQQSFTMFGPVALIHSGNYSFHHSIFMQKNCAPKSLSPSGVLIEATARNTPYTPYTPYTPIPGLLDSF